MEERGEKKRKDPNYVGYGVHGGVYEKQMETKHLLTSMGISIRKTKRSNLLRNKKNKKN